MYTSQQMMPYTGMPNMYGGQQMMPYTGMPNMYGGQQMMPYTGMPNMYGGQQMMPYTGMPNMYGGQQMMPYTGMPYMYGDQQMMPYSGMPYMYGDQQMMPYTGMPYMYGDQQMMPYSGMPSQMDPDPQMIPHPGLVEAKQIAPNQIEIVYDQRADLGTATNISNYWIRNNQLRAADIANLGKDDMITATNGISPTMGMITATDNSKMRFVMTFRANATAGVQYTVLPCFVNLEGRSGFMGENWGPFSKNTFIAK